MSGCHLDAQQAAEIAALYAAGAMPDDQRTAHDQHLATCAKCQNELAAFEEVVVAIATSVPEVAPSTALQQRLAANVGRATTQVWKRWQASDEVSQGVHLTSARDAVWESTGVDGVTARRLALDRQNDRVTMLIRMQAGAVYPGHRHGGIEDCYVLEGDLVAGDIEMTTGDFMRAELGSIHEPQSTRDGCLLLIVSSLSDELLA